jgi:ABC-type amino acid transport substrate-binding protein
LKNWLGRWGAVSALVCAVHSAASAAEQQPENAIFGNGWGMTLALDGTGFYNDVIHQVLASGAVQKPYLPLPYKRAKTEFAKTGGSCLYPARIEHLRRGGEIGSATDYVETLPLVLVESHIFSRPGMPPLTSLDELAGRLVAYPNGSALPTAFGKYGATFVPTTDETTKARMLIAGRVDHMSGSLPDNFFVFKALGEDLPPYNPEMALIRIGVGVVCHKTAENEALVEMVNAALAKPESRAALEAIFRDAGLEDRFLPRW